MCASPIDRRRFLQGTVAAFGSALVAGACASSDGEQAATLDRVDAPDASSPGSATETSGSPSAAGTSGTATTARPATVGAADSTPSAPASTTAPVTAPNTFDPTALYIALYGHPGSTTLGVLGEQDASGGVERTRQVAAGYEGFGMRVVPTFEIIATVASSELGADEDYSNEFGIEKYQPFIDAAAANDMHVVFDLQSGRATFPGQAREHEDLWLYPHVSIALDPEWRTPGGRPVGGEIGTVDAAEVNATIDYIDELVIANSLPPKMCIVHQFTPSMITNKMAIRGTDNVHVLIQMDGFGSLPLKRNTWNETVATLPEGALTGWKNFYDEDDPTPTPAETMANEPTPHFVSYQ